MKLVPVVTGLDRPTDLQTVDGKLHVVLQRGRIVVVDNGKVLPTPFLDMESKVVSGGELGLLGLAFHPQYARNGKYYVNYTVRKEGFRTVIAERRAGSAVEKEILSFAQPYSNHNGGQIAFGPDGQLYIGTGDGGDAGDPHGNGQSKSSLLAKMLRLDVDRAGAKPEIWAWGLRNPWRFSFDPVSKLLFAADVGQDAWEEIDIVEKGGNYGWNVREGKHCFRPPKDCKTEGLIDPIWEYDHGEGFSITGGFVYRGKKIPSLAGKYVYADFGSGKIWALTVDFAAKKAVKNELLLASGVPVSTFGLDADGELLVGDYRGKVLRLIP